MINAQGQRIGGPYRCCVHCVDDPGYHAGPEAVNTHTVTCGYNTRCTAGGDEPVSTAVILWCGHDWSLTGAEGPIDELRKRGRPWPLLWSCDTCGATVLDLGEGWVPMPMWRGARP